MIEVINRELLIPREEYNIGTCYDDNTETRHFHLKRVTSGGVDLAALTFNLDILYANGSTDAASLLKEVTDKDINLVLTINNSMLQVPGTVLVQIRALDEDGVCKWTSYKSAFFVEDHINTPGHYEGDLTQLEQYEAEWGKVRDNVNQLNLRMDEVVRIREESPATEVEEEIVDARVGADNIVYGSLGSAIRKQFENVYEEMEDDTEDWVAAVAAEATARQNADTAEATARQSADNTLQGNINSEAATRASADSNLQSQINQIIAPSGEAPSAAEVQNARIGADGKTYSTLGDAIRTNDNNLKSEIAVDKKVSNSIINVVYNKDTEIPFIWENGQLIDNGVEGDSIYNQRTKFFTPVLGKKVKVRATINAMLVIVFEYDNDFNFLEKNGTYENYISPVNSSTAFIRLCTYSTVVAQSSQHTYVDAVWENDSYIDLDGISDNIEKAKLPSYIEDSVAKIRDGEESSLRMVHIMPKQEGSGTPSSTNIRPFEQINDIYIMSTGENMFPNLRPVTNGGGITMENVDNGGIRFYGTATGDYYHNFIKTEDHFILQKGTYTLKYDGDTLPEHCALYFRSDKLTYSVKKRTITVDQYRDYSVYMSIPRGTTIDVTIYPKLFIGKDRTIDSNIRIDEKYLEFSNQYYGCVVNLRTGKVLNNYGHIASYNNENINGYWYSDRDVYTEGGKPTIGAEVVYVKHAEEAETINPIEIKIGFGSNNVWANHHKIGVEYNTTPIQYIEHNIDYVSPEMFGAVGDGVTDDKDSIQAAIDFAVKYKKVVQLSQRTYYVGSPLVVSNAQGFILRGCGISGYFTSVNKPKIIIDSNYQNLGINGVIYLYRCKLSKISGITIEGVSSTLHVGIQLYESHMNEIDDCNILKFSKGLYINYSGLNKIARNNVSACRTGIETVCSGDSQYTDNYINTNTLGKELDDDDGLGRNGTGILLSTGSNHSNISGGKIEWNGHGIWIGGSQGITITGVQFDYNMRGSIVINGNSFSDASQAKSITITGNYFRSGGVRGEEAQIVLISTVTDIIAALTGNIFMKASGNDTTDLDICPKTILKTMSDGGNNKIKLTMVGNNMYDGATLNSLELTADNTTIVYKGNLDELGHVITGSNVVIDD